MVIGTRRIIILSAERIIKTMSGLEGTTLGHYLLLERLRQGGMSEVYLAHDESMNRDVAVKVVVGTQTDYLERFRREAEAIGRLDHDHILPAFDYGDQDPWHYLVMPYIAQATLRERLLDGPLSLEETEELLTQIADALQYAHDNGIVHRDIKPSNILMRNEHYIYLADFGLAKSLEGGDQLTQTGALLGTPEYMAPDLAYGPATTSSDIYALGVLLYQMVAGRVPFVGDTPIATYWKQMNEQPVPPSAYNPTLSRAIDLVVLKALAKDPRYRFQSALELAQAFQRALYTPEQYIAEVTPANTVKEQAQRRSKKMPSMMPYMRPSKRIRTRSTPPSGERLVLPSNPIKGPTSIFSRRRQVVAKESALPPLRVHETEDVYAGRVATDEVAYPATPQPPSRRSCQRVRRRSRRSTALAISIIAIGLLLIVGLPMSFIYYAATHQPNVPTVVVPATGQSAAAAQSQQAQATATAGVLTNATHAPLILTDPLTINTNGRWTQDATHCGFTSNAYTVNVTQTDFLQPCALLNSIFDNATIQADVTLQTGSDAGILIRAVGEQFYDFEITDKGQFFFRRHDPGAGTNYMKLIPETTSNAILPEAQKNTLSIIAKNDDFKLFINGVFVDEIRDNTYASGQFAFVAGTLAPLKSGVAQFSDLKIYNA